MKISPLAGKPAPPNILVDVPRLIAAYYADEPDPSVPAQRVAFGTSGHRGSSFQRSFNEWHILAITQAICQHRAQQNISGPLFLGIDTHALSVPACATALEVLAANGVEVMLAKGDEYTPTPVISHAILTYNRERKTGLADGIVITPSHNPPNDGGFKYNPPNGGPADNIVTDWIEAKANAFLKARLDGVKRIPHEQALQASTTHRHDYLNTYVNDLGNVIDLDVIRGANLRLGVDPLGGAGVHYWSRIAERHGLNLTVVNETIDPTFRFMTVDWDGKIRMDPSSPYAMERLIGMKDRFDLSFACDTDHDRHGIVTKSAGLLPPNHFLAVAISQLFPNRPHWRPEAAVGKTVVSSAMIDRVTARHERKLFEVPVGFKWFVDGLLDGSLGFGGEESAGATFVRLDGTVWTTDKDGFIPCLLAAEITARTGRDPGELYGQLTQEFDASFYDRIEAPATPGQKSLLAKLSPTQVKLTELAGEKIETVLTRAPGNGAPIGGLKVAAASGWFAARPSGTEELYKIYAESFRGLDHLHRIVDEAQTIVSAALPRCRTSKCFMKPANPSILTINGGSSSIKFALYSIGESLERGLHGKIDRIGSSGANLTFTESNEKSKDSCKVDAADHKVAAKFLIDWLEEQTDFDSVKAVGHRVVHGMQHTAPELITPELIEELHRITTFDPEHLPGEIELIEAFRQRHPKLPQVACFDTAFHRDMPRVAKLLAIPRRYEAKGVQRYGFHGLSYAYLLEELARLGDPAATKGRVILAHLGNGASMAAVRDGKSIDTSMGFTPVSGLPMSTRSGDLDPGLVSYLARTEKMSAPQFQEMVNHESGLLGVSEISSDMRDLLAQETTDVRAAEAVALFCYQAKKWIGSFAAALGGLDTLVFAGGIGESAPLIRERICDGLGFLGIELSPQRNAENEALISTNGARVSVRVIHTDEEFMMAKSVTRLLQLEAPNEQ